MTAEGADGKGSAEVVVTVLVPGVLRGECGNQPTLTVTSAPVLGALFDRIAAEQPRLHRRLRDEQLGLRRYVNVYVDGEDCRQTGLFDTPLRSGAEVQILPSVAGG